MELVSADQLEAELRLPEAYYSSVQEGKTLASLRSPLTKGQLKLPITRVISDIDTARGTFAVRVAIPADQRGGLISGAFVTAEVALGCPDPCVIVPIRAVVQERDKAFVMVADKDKMARRGVELGDRLTEGIIIKSGLAAGEKVVVGPALALKDGAALPEHLRQQGEAVPLGR
jgi:RND family efflux transporter MFP subunit